MYAPKVSVLVVVFFEVAPLSPLPLQATTAARSAVCGKRRRNPRVTRQPEIPLQSGTNVLEAMLNPGQENALGGPVAFRGAAVERRDVKVQEETDRAREVPIDSCAP